VSLWERLHDEAYGEADAIHDEVYAKRLRESKPQPSFSHLRAETMDEWLPAGSHPGYVEEASRASHRYVALDAYGRRGFIPRPPEGPTPRHGSGRSHLVSM
jgi:hypothetical protein